ncbi:Nif3-like dinuclear metal center hexameric protein [Pseudohongiella sp. SYSU M77423]|uniref:Nif3-like dinuclear metal center hexameric protein n=1 Tax=unclassified Pseudohongiella TaxID=2629611 RepID=UPI001EFFA4C6|nr:MULTISPECIES: Nif3-like dinuclear metal center hexameric protein [unclassified Pseudohongiella]MDH7944600.1 Nif3-like dinuclear metal center hexameric protein [Pseudohongiella sp. SYSU M77423]
MPIDRRTLLKELDSLLKTDQFNDYCPNGLQVEGKDQIRHVVSGVTASQAMIEAAAAAGADLLLVHHGYFWRGESSVITGLKQRRVRLLLEHDINLVAYHLPLDAHPELGNNTKLAAVLGLPVSGELTKINRQPMGLYSELETPMTGESLRARIHEALQREPLHIAPQSLLSGAGRDMADRPIRRIAWCTGAAQSYIERAVEIGADAFISGEISEPTVHMAREHGIHYFAAGHHATERYGVQALGEWIAQQFDVSHQFIDIDNPV